MLKKVFIKVAQKFLHRPDLVFSEEIPLSYFLSISIQRVFMLLRGYIRGIWFAKRGNRLFIGKNVSLKCANKIHVGNGVSIQDGVKINALSKDGVWLGNNSSIGENTKIRVSGSLTEMGKSFHLGNYSTLANDCFVGAAGGVEIGDYVAVGQNVRFHSENHEFSDPNILICKQGTSHKGIKIGNDCWIGAGAVFLDGSEVGDGCVVGAGSIVTKKIPPYSVVAGIPARVIKERK